MRRRFSLFNDSPDSTASSNDSNTASSNDSKEQTTATPGALAAQLLKKTTLDHVRRSHVRGIETLSKACGAQTLAGRRARGGATTPPAEQRAPRNRYLSLWRSRSRPRATRRRDRRRAAGRAAGAARPLPLRGGAASCPHATRHLSRQPTRRRWSSGCSSSTPRAGIPPTSRRRRRSAGRRRSRTSTRTTRPSGSPGC